MRKIVALLILSVLFLSACTDTQTDANISTNSYRPLDGKAIIVMPIKSTYTQYSTELLITSLEKKGFNVVPYSLVQKTAYDLGFQAEHRFLPEGDSIYERSSQLAIAKKLGVLLFFSGNIDSIEISDDSFSNAIVSLDFIRSDTGKSMWGSSHKPGFWTFSITSKGHIKDGIKSIVNEFAQFEKSLH